MDRRRFMLGAAAIAGGMVARPAIAEAETEISFFYPVAVGGPITKIIDGFAAEFEKENPRVKVKPIYAGTYQESIAKALTARRYEKYQDGTTRRIGFDGIRLIDGQGFGIV